MLLFNGMLGEYTSFEKYYVFLEKTFKMALSQNIAPKNPMFDHPSPHSPFWDIHLFAEHVGHPTLQPAPLIAEKTAGC
jgi:hypothetical protein